ncbi:hypothetical protein CLOM_g9660 [Closterium sp. NIES-68]|nr:hypothetical protein CLOM_g9660 [Closterium sp. NIES-68]GJP58503.1 hypothetical protein CLOP_g362 [Closterium sp. NIES-67]
MSFYDMTVEKYASLPLHTLTLRQMLAQGEEALKDPNFMVRNARFVHKEMPVRLAKRLMDLQFLPHIVVINPHIKQVYDSYRQAFDMLTAFPEIKTLEDNAKFTQMITMLVDDHTPLLGVLARGVRECALRPLVGRELDLDPFLDNMLRSRISRRVIAEHHICLQHQRPGFIGVICSQLSMRTLVEAATKQCTDVSRRTFGFCPDFEMHGDVDSTFAYVPAHIEYMLFEILKNASRAVVEHHLKKAHEEGKSISQATFPPVTITVCRGQKESTIKVSDQGGGIANELKEKVWSYGFSSLDEDTEAIQPAGPLDSHGSPMAGLGFGLPLSRLHAQYFGGDIEFFSIPGYGTDVYIRVHRLGDHQEEFEI